MADHPHNVLYLSYDGLTDPLGQSQILPYLLGLSNKGYQITVVSFEKPSAFENEGKLVEDTIRNKIKWVPLRYHKDPPVLSTLWDLWLLWKTVKKIYYYTPFHLVHCRSYLTSLIGLRAKRKWKIKFIFDMRGFWADERVEGGLWNLNNPLYKIIYRYFKEREKELFVEADHIISLTKNARQEILSWQINATPISVIPTCVDMNLFDPGKISSEDQRQLKGKLGIGPDDFVLLYLGSWGTWYLTSEMLMFFTVLRSQRPNAKLLIVSGDQVDFDDYPVKEEVIVTKAPRHLVPLYVSLASAAVFFIKPSFSKKASSATKMGEIMAMGVPVITNSGWGDVEEILGGDLSGLILNDFTDESFKNATAWLQSITKHESKKHFNTLEYLSLDSGIVLYEKIYNSLIYC